MGNDLTQANIMAPAATERASAHVARMFDRLKKQNRGDSVKSYASDYIQQVSKYPEWAIEAAVGKYIGGRIEGHSGVWVPEIGEFCKTVIEEVGIVAAKEKEKKNFLDQKRRIAEWKACKDEKTPDSRARIGDMRNKQKAEWKTNELTSQASTYGPTRTETERTNQKFNPSTQTYRAPNKTN